MKNVDEMSAQELKAAIAEALGWKHIRLDGYGFHPEGHGGKIPDYPGDMTACYTIEEQLTPDQRVAYGELLAEWACELPLDEFTFGVAHAPPALRCRAWLKVAGKANDNAAKKG